MLPDDKTKRVRSSNSFVSVTFLGWNGGTRPGSAKEHTFASATPLGQGRGHSLDVPVLRPSTRLKQYKSACRWHTLLYWLERRGIIQTFMLELDETELAQSIQEIRELLDG
jgi:hypothetical protein